MADSEVATLTDGTPLEAADDFYVARSAGTLDRRIPASSIGAYLFKRIAGASGAAGEFKTLQNLTADGTVTGTTLEVEMTTTGVGAGTWHFKYFLIMQTDLATAGIGLAINHTGTVGQFHMFAYFPTTGGTTTTRVHDEINSSATVGMVEQLSEQAINTASAVTTGGPLNSDFAVCVEGIIVVTATGSLELKIKSELAGQIATVAADSCLELTKVE